MTTVHFVYPHGTRISCPDAIGRHVGKRLNEHFSVNQYDWIDTGVIHPGRDDILLGHAHPAPWTIFRKSAQEDGWKRIVLLEPYNPDGNQVAFLDGIIPLCNQFLAITGNFWFSRIRISNYSHWFPKMIHVDLAVDRNEFPFLKYNFNPPGKRRFVYIGHTNPTKNTPYLSEIAKSLPGIVFNWIGDGGTIENLSHLGYQDFSTDSAKKLIPSFDFLITVGENDANPSTILESMAWGLIPVCTPQSGYINYPGIVNIPLGDLETAISILNELQTMNETKLREMQSINIDLLDKHFNWERFAGQVIRSIRSDSNPELETIPARLRIKIGWTALTSNNSFLNPRNVFRYKFNNFLAAEGRKALGIFSDSY